MDDFIDLFPLFVPCNVYMIADINSRFIYFILCFIISISSIFYIQFAILSEFQKMITKLILLLCYFIAFVLVKPGASSEYKATSK